MPPAPEAAPGCQARQPAAAAVQKARTSWNSRWDRARKRVAPAQARLATWPLMSGRCVLAAHAGAVTSHLMMILPSFPRRQAQQASIPAVGEQPDRAVRPLAHV